MIAGSGTARVWAERALPEEELKRVAGAFLWGSERTPEQDIRYRFQQLTDAVIRALSLDRDLDNRLVALR